MFNNNNNNSYVLFRARYMHAERVHGALFPIAIEDGSMYLQP